MYSQPASTANSKDKQEQDLNEFESAIVLLKRDFEMFFSGTIKLPPLDFRDKLARKLQLYGRASDLSSAQRFRYNSLFARFNSYAELWEKQLRMKEEGRSSSGAFFANTTRRKRPPAVGTSVTADSPVEKLYSDFVSARKKCGENCDQVTLNKFEDLLKSQRQSILTKYGCKDVDFYVTVEGNRTKLKARLIK